jgi:2-dehydropantoate 2-reductase
LDHEKLFWFSNGSNVKTKSFASYFDGAGIESYLVDAIEETVWKNHFISALASATSYLDQNIGQIIGNDSSRAIYVLLNEITMIAAVKLNLPDDIIMQTIIKLEKTPQDAIINA